MTMPDTCTPAQPWPWPRWLAHRGAGKLAPENTLAAFRLGASLGWRAFECDVKLSADGLPFLLHDATLERTSSGTGPAAALPWDALSQLDAGRWHSPAYAGEPPPTLAALAAFVQANGHALNIEIKPSPGAETDTGRAVALTVRRLWGTASASPVAAPAPLLSSFRPEALLAAQQAAPELPRALLADEPWAGWFEVAQQLRCAAIITNYRWMDAAVAAQAHANGMKAMVYTVNDAAEVQRLWAAGVDAIITDRVDAFGPADRTPAGARPDQSGG